VARELRTMGWRAIVIPPQLDLEARRRIMWNEKARAIFLQKSWHPLNRPRLYAGIPCVFDADDASFNESDLVAECCGESREVIAGSQFLANWFRTYNPQVTTIWTGTYIKRSRRMMPNSSRRPIVTWAQSDPRGFPEEAEFVREVLLELAKKVKFCFHLYGLRDRSAAEEYVSPLRAAGVETELIPFLRYKKFIRSLETAAVGFQPICSTFSRAKNFGKLLAYIVAGVAVIASSEGEHTLFFRDRENGMLAAGVSDWVESCRVLLAQAEKRGELAERAYLDLTAKLTTRKSAELVKSVLDRAAGMGSWMTAGGR
jgi:hypothetical protein